MPRNAEQAGWEPSSALFSDLCAVSCGATGNPCRRLLWKLLFSGPAGGKPFKRGQRSRVAGVGLRAGQSRD